MAKFVEQGHIDKLVTSDNVLPKRLKLDNHEPLQEVLNTSKVTKEVAEILAPLETSSDPQFVLIEGAPGIGKSLLLKQIAYLWAKKQILQKFKLVLLLCLRDPAVRQMSLIDDLLQPFCTGDRRAIEISSACSDYLLENDGEDLVLLLDGYDEYPETLRKDSLIASLVKHRVLPQCGLIVSSRPHASVNLRDQATVKVDILGFTEAEREHYITQSMKGQPQKVMNSHNIFKVTQQSAVYVLYPSTLLSWFTCTNREFPFLKILLNYTIILFVLPSADTLRNMLIISKVTSPR